MEAEPSIRKQTSCERIRGAQRYVGGGRFIKITDTFKWWHEGVIVGSIDMDEDSVPLLKIALFYKLYEDLDIPGLAQEHQITTGKNHE